MARIIDFVFGVDWGRNGSYTDESARLINASGSMRFTPPDQTFMTGRGYISQALFTLNNSDGYFSSLYSSGAHYTDLAEGAGYHLPVNLRVSIDGVPTYSYIFTGIAKIPEESAPNTKDTATVTMDCRSREEEILDYRISTTVGDFSNWHDAQKTEGNLIKETLADAGLSSGTDYTDSTIDAGRFIVPFYWLDDESPVEEIWQLAQACGGRFYADPEGVFRYEALDHWLFSPHTTSQQTYNEDDYQSLELKYEDGNLFSKVTVEASPRVKGSPTLLWQPDELPVIPANSTKTITARLQQPGYAINSATYTAVTAGGMVITSDVSLSQTSYAQRVELAFTNANTVYGAHLRNLTITGTPVVGGPTIEETESTVNAFWSGRNPRVKAARGNVYVQQRAHAATMAEYMRDQLQVPSMTYNMRGCPGIPARRLGDYITINDAAMTPDGARTAYVTGVTWRLSSQGFVQDIQAIDSDNVFQYAPADYFIIGTDVLGAGVGYARIYY